MRPPQALLDQIFLDQIRQARRMSPEERVREGLHLSDLAMQVMADGVRHQHPNTTQEELNRLIRERMKRVRRIKDLR